MINICIILLLSLLHITTVRTNSNATKNKHVSNEQVLFNTPIKGLQNEIEKNIILLELTFDKHIILISSIWAFVELSELIFDHSLKNKKFTISIFKISLYNDIITIETSKDKVKYLSISYLDLDNFKHQISTKKNNSLKHGTKRLYIYIKITPNILLTNNSTNI